MDPLVGHAGVRVIVVDNASSDGCLDEIGDLELTTIRCERNGGFGGGCNVGWRAGESPYVLFLNPDATIDVAAIGTLVGVLERDETVGIVSPKIVDDTDAIDPSRRRFPRVLSTFAQALFVHRLLPRARWTDEVLRDEHGYARAADVEWVSGACLLVRRSLLEQLDGWDEGFFLYSEDTDLCRRAWAAGFRVRYEPEAVARHAGGDSAPRPALLPLLAESRIRYARKHRRRVAVAVERAGIALGSLTHALAPRRDADVRRGHLGAFAVAIGARSSRSASVGSRPAD